MGFDLPPEMELPPPLLKEADDPLLGAILDTDCGRFPHPVSIKPPLASVMKAHQREGVQFLYQNTFGSLERLDEPGGGCILVGVNSTSLFDSAPIISCVQAHRMGLGKSFQVIAYLHAVRDPTYSLLVSFPAHTLPHLPVFSDTDQCEDQSKGNPTSSADGPMQCSEPLGRRIHQMARRQRPQGDSLAPSRRHPSGEARCCPEVVQCPR